MIGSLSRAEYLPYPINDLLAVVLCSRDDVEALVRKSTRGWSTLYKRWLQNAMFALSFASERDETQVCPKAQARRIFLFVFIYLIIELFTGRERCSSCTATASQEIAGCHRRGNMDASAVGRHRKDHTGHAPSVHRLTRKLLDVLVIELIDDIDQ